MVSDLRSHNPSLIRSARNATLSRFSFSRKMSTPPSLFEGIATATAGLVAGGMMYITLVEAPARSKLSAPDQLKHWRTTFSGAKGLFKPSGLILIPTLSTAGYLTNKPVYYAAAGAFGLLAPFTVIAIAPTNTRLLTMKEPADEDANVEVTNLVRLWAQRHAIRVVFSTVGFGLCLYGFSNSTQG